jgi:hypothetical protein
MIPKRAANVYCGMDQSKFKESFKVAADQLVDAVKKLLHEGNVRRIVIKQEGRTVAEFPLTVGVVGAVIAPVLAAVGALAAVLGECTVEVERTSGS